MASPVPAGGYTPPIYPYARLDELKQVAGRADGGIVDLSVGTPNDPVPEVVLRALERRRADVGRLPPGGRRPGAAGGRGGVDGADASA